MKNFIIILVIFSVILALYFYLRRAIITIDKIDETAKSINYTIKIDGETFVGTKYFSDKITHYYKTKTAKNIDVVTTANGFEIKIYTNNKIITKKSISINL